MATITQAVPPATGATLAPAESRILLLEIPWPLYETLRESPANRHVRMAYDRGSLELMSPSQRHEESAVRIGHLVMTIAGVLGIKCKPLAATTWKRVAETGKEADGCFYIANYARVRGKSIDLSVDPPPDLAIEVEISRSALDSLAIYAALGVPEVWRFDGQVLRIFVREADGTYAERDRGLSLPLLTTDELSHWLGRAATLDDDVSWIEEVRAWALAALVPRYRPPG